jgi:hypothetical protein
MTTTNETTPNIRDCPNCGMPREDWPDGAQGGYLEGDTVYCCRGCIQGPGCTCKSLDRAVRAPTQDEIRHDPRSREFVQSLQHQTDHIGPEDYGTDVTKGRPSTNSASND